MLDIKWIRENPEALEALLEKRGWAPDADFIEQFTPDLQVDFESGIGPDDRRHRSVKAVLRVDELRRAQIVYTQNVQERRNAASKEIGQAKAAKDEARAHALMAEVASLKDAVRTGEEAERVLTDRVNRALARIPNTPLDDVPVGPDERANVEVRAWGEPRQMNWAKEHFELGEAMGLMDFEAASKLSGSRFVVLRGQLARMERALGQFMLDLHTNEHGYTEVQPPLLVKDSALFGTAQLPKFAEDQFRTQRAATEQDAARLEEQLTRTESPLAEVMLKMGAEFSRSLWLIPTAEVPLTNLVREQILDEATLPLRFTALTPCFRSEAGSAGRDTRGMLRQHQFDKVELVSITTPEKSLEEHERMTACAEEVLRQLDLAYQVVLLSTGDMGFASRKTYDLEVWLPGQKAFREISSCSVCGDFQARRMQARYRPKDAKQPQFVHTLNGSGVAVGRALIAVMETYQNDDGSITVPDVLRPYMGGLEKVGG